MSGTVFITGSSTGLGRATAGLFARKGWNVVATMRDPSAAADLAGRDDVLVTRLDVTDPASIAHATKAGLERFGSLDVLVNNAGYRQYGIFETVPAEKIRRNYDVNVFGVVNVTRALVPLFRAQGEGLILNVNSMAGDGVKHFVEARRKMSDEEYEDYMRAQIACGGRPDID